MEHQPLKNHSSIAIAADSNGDGFNLRVFDNQNLYVKYPTGIFNKFPAKDFLIDNFVYARTCTLAVAENKTLQYQTGRPFFKDFIDWGVNSELGRVADVSKISTSELTRRFLAKKLAFSKNKRLNSALGYNGVAASRALLALSFGKDSLLSYGLAKEIGLNCRAVTDLDKENYTPRAWRQRTAIINNFQKQEKQKIIGFRDNVDTLHFNRQLIKKPIEELENLNGMLAFALELMPVAYFAQAKYIIFGNEKNLDDYYFNDDGVKSYPSFDQSAVYTKKMNQLFNAATAGNMQIVSLVEQIYNIAEMKILYHRYPRLLKYVMSCYPKKHSPDRWCQSCSMCAKAFLYAAAFGDPLKLGIKAKMFSLKEKELYPLFAKKISNRPYEKPKPVREEQLLAFLLSFRRGWRGPLMDVFKAKFLSEALKNEAKLRRKFFGIYPAVSTPKQLQPKLLKIFKQELFDWQ